VRVWGPLAARADVDATEREVLARVGDRARYLLVGDVAAALVVVDPPWAGVFCMVVAPDRRREGLARALLGAATSAAATAPATHLYLQVEADNAPARRLYASAGFSDVPALAYRYRRRIASTTADSGARFSR
jgi:ribosomal protein S18 acetylase RimI-like enzyme